MSYCHWKHTSDANKKYHDAEWGIPLHEDRGQFEYLMLEVLQCGLNWDLIINKREIFCRCFDGFDYDKIATYSDNDVKRILNTPGMIKSPCKIMAIINNAKQFRHIRKEFGSFEAYLWGFCGDKTILYNKHEKGLLPASNGLSDKISRDLKKRGFKFLGSIVIYSYLQACGIINDHDKNCFRYRYIVENYPTVRKRRFLEKKVQRF